MTSTLESEGVPSSPASAAEIASALELLKTLLQLPELKKILDPEERKTSQMVYTNAVTLWMLILQRLGGGKSLCEVVAQVLAHGGDLLPDNKRVRDNTLSNNSTAYSQARKRLPLETILEFSHGVCMHLGEISEPVIAGQRVFILDGTTLTLPPTQALKEAFPPASNQHGPSVWPVAQLLLAHELQSGCALLPQIDPMYGDNNVSEAVQAQRIVQQLPAQSIVMADSGFGIYSVAFHTAGAGHDFLFRLTRQRFKSYRRQAELMDEGPNHQTYQLLWTPSAKDRKSNPDLPADASLDVVLHEVKLPSGQSLCLVSTLQIDGPSAATLYRRRYDIEFDIRDVKVTLDTENIRARSVEMFKKELYTSIVAYNLVAQFRRQAAQVAQVTPRRLSFTGVWTTMKYFLILQPQCSFEEWLDRYDKALRRASKQKLPQRDAPRSYPRKAHPRHQKSTKFECAERKKKKKEAASPPLMEQK